MKQLNYLFYCLIFAMQVKAQAPDSWLQRSSLGSSATPRVGAVSFSIGNKGYIGTGEESYASPAKKDFWEYDPATNIWTQKADFAGGERSYAAGFGIGNKGYIGTGNYQKDFWEYDPNTNTWKQKADFGGIGRSNALGFNIGNKGYIGMGDNGFLPSEEDFWEYDPATDKWTQKADFGGGNRVGAVGFGIGNKGYAGTGVYDSAADDGHVFYSIIKKDFWQYNPSTDTWIRKADMPAERTGATGFSTPRSGLVCTGYNYTQGYLKDFWEYLPGIDRWKKRADFPGGERKSCISFSIGRNGYAGGGFDGSVLKNDFWEYRYAANAWEKRASLGGLGRTDATGFSIGDKGYAGTGYGNTGSTYSDAFNDFWEFDPANNLWTQKADFAGGKRRSAVSFSIGNKGYVGTGSDGNGTYQKDFWEYDPVTNNWIKKADFGGGVRSGAVGFTIDNKGYAGTGSNGQEASAKDFWEYDPATDKWTQKANFKGNASVAAFSIGARGYIVGVTSDFFYTNDLWEYNPLTNRWTKKADFPGLGRTSTTGFAIGNKGYFGLGFGQDSTLGYLSFKKDFWEYDPAIDAWERKADFDSTARSDVTGFSIGNYGYIGFGTDFFGYYNDWWQYTPSGKSISQSNIAEVSVNNTKDLLAYPNPVKDILHITSACTKDKMLTMRITDMYGHLVYAKQIIPVTDNFECDVNVGSFVKGMYAIQLLNGKEISKTIFIKE